MRQPPAVSDSVIRWVEQFAGERARERSVERKTLSGGLEAASVSLVTARYRDELGRQRILRFVFKQLQGRAVREADVYQHLASKHADELSPRLLAVEYSAPEQALLCIEAVRRTRAWPWVQISPAAELLARLARFHHSARRIEVAIPEWDYESELARSAEETWTTVDRCRRNPDMGALARDLPPLTRMVVALPRLRRQLLSELPFGSGPIHGDVHPGNAVVRRRGRGDEPLLFDWGRARTGSPLEDVSSWLQSLGYWEHEAKRYHDTLLAHYLSAFGADGKLTSDVRAAYWMAGASNALAGAVIYHLAVTQDESQSANRRAAGLRAARDWLRVIRRADAWWS